MCRPKWCSKARNAGNSGTNGGSGSSQEGETECSNRLVNALKTRLDDHS